MKYKTYRNEIDGLRAIAVMAVIAFHFGYNQNGFLGVDVFFVISGFLITGIIYKEINENNFSIVDFYLRRIRRIIPLSLFIGLIALLLGIFTMLPDDLENLAQSVIATNFFSNNILQAITTKNYWDVINEYKPLMHTWSLGVEEQYYLFYPFLFVIYGKKKQACLLFLLSVITIASMALYLLPFQEYQKFYLIFFRFWELSVGGIAVIVLNNRCINRKYANLLTFCLILMLFFDFSIFNKELSLLITVFLTLGILLISNNNDSSYQVILENKFLGFIGKISFSLYMWHQLVLSYVRYYLYQELGVKQLIGIFSLTLILSLISYFLIEEPFRKKSRINTKMVLTIVGFIFCLTTITSLYIYSNAGILRDIPELGITRSHAVRNIHGIYNARVCDYDKNFSLANKINVLVIGNSFARDWANVLLESRYAKDLQISYIEEAVNNEKLKVRVEGSDIIFMVSGYLQDLRKLGIPEKKAWAIGTKNFGVNNGIFYNYKGRDYYIQRTKMEKGYMENNDIMRREWKDKYIDYIGKVIDQNKTVPVFTPFNQFISQDTRHFTKAGAQYYAKLFESDLAIIFTNRLDMQSK